MADGKPNKIIENGKATYWTKPECSAIKLQMKKNETGNQNKALLQSKGRVMLSSEAKIETELHKVIIYNNK